MKFKSEKADLALKEQESVWKATNKDLLMMVELLRKEKAEKVEEHVVVITEVIAKVKGSFLVAVWEAKIKLPDDVANAGFWNIVG